MRHEQLVPPGNLAAFERIVEPHMRRRIFCRDHRRFIGSDLFQGRDEAFRITREEYARSVRKRFAPARYRELDEHRADGSKNGKNDRRYKKYLPGLAVVATAPATAPEERAEENIREKRDHARKNCRNG